MIAQPAFQCTTVFQVEGVFSAQRPIWTWFDMAANISPAWYLCSRARHKKFLIYFQVIIHGNGFTALAIDDGSFSDERTNMLPCGWSHSHTPWDVGSLSDLNPTTARGAWRTNSEYARMLRWRSERVESKMCDVEGIAHTVEVTAASLYEAVALGLRAIRTSDWADYGPQSILLSFPEIN